MSALVLLEDMLDRSVRFNGMYIPARNLQTTLGRYCTNLCAWTHDDQFMVRLLGTAIPLLYRERYLLVCTAHQLRGVNPEDVCLLYADGSLAVTSSGARTMKNELAMDSDAYDIAAFDFTDPMEEHKDLRSGFLRFDAVPPDAWSDQVIALATSGFPSADQNYDLGENNHIGFVKRNLAAILGEKPSDITQVRGRFTKPLDFDPDGMSGSPVFVIQHETDGPSAYLAGLLQRSGRSGFYFLKSGVVREFLDSFLDSGPSAPQSVRET